MPKTTGGRRKKGKKATGWDQSETLGFIFKKALKTIFASFATFKWQ